MKLDNKDTKIVMGSRDIQGSVITHAQQLGDWNETEVRWCREPGERDKTRTGHTQEDGQKTPGQVNSVNSGEQDFSFRIKCCVCCLEDHK